MAKGTRNTIKLDRPWQVPIKIDSKKCPFAPSTLKKEEIIRQYCGGEWLLITNIYTPHVFHQMLIPRKCWDREKLWSFGSAKEKSMALEIIVNIVKESDRDFVHVSVHSGYLAGQNVSHLHYHILDPTDEDVEHFIRVEKLSLDTLRSTVEAESRTIFRHKNITVVAGGHRAGQCYLFVDGDFDCADFGKALHRLIMLYAEKFKSRQGLYPDYGVGLVFKGGQFHHGLAVPVLNNWGVTDYSALSGGGVITLPWSHEVTAMHLRSDM